jgi:hypothetical protein
VTILRRRTCGAHKVNSLVEAYGYLWESKCQWNDCRWVWDKWGSRLYPSEMFWERGIKPSRDVVEGECSDVSDVFQSNFLHTQEPGIEPLTTCLRGPKPLSLGPIYCWCWFILSNWLKKRDGDETFLYIKNLNGCYLLCKLILYWYSMKIKYLFMS